MKDPVIETSEKLCEFSPRLWANEEKAANFIEEKFQEKSVDYNIQENQVTYPHLPVYKLEADEIHGELTTTG